MNEFQEFLNVLETGGIDISIGMECCADMEDIYYDVVQTYYEENDTKKLIDALNAGDAMLYGTISHGMKSASKSIGAMEFAELAFEFEKMGKDGKLDEIRAGHDDFIAKYNELQKLLKNALDTVEA